MTLEIKAILVGLLLGIGALGYFGWRYHIESLGEAKIEAQDARARAEQLQHDKTLNEKAVADLQAQNATLAQQLSAAPVPVVRLCQPAAPARKPSAGAPGVAGQGSAGVGSGAPVQSGAVRGADIGPGLRLLATVAEALAAQNRALLERDRALSRAPDAVGE